jgi:hypothetical protein
MQRQSEYDQQGAAQPRQQGGRRGQGLPRDESPWSYAESLNDYSYRRGYAAQQYPEAGEEVPAEEQQQPTESFSERQLAPQVLVRSPRVPWWARPPARSQGLREKPWLLALLIVLALAIGAPPLLALGALVFSLLLAGLGAVVGLAIACLVVAPMLAALGFIGLLLFRTLQTLSRAFTGQRRGPDGQ